MTDSDDDKLTRLLNASGFAFQLAVEEAVRKGKYRSPWRVTGREHPWATDTGRGYIDLVLTQGKIHLAVECKRSRDAVWMFLMPDADQMSRSHARVCWTQTVPQRAPLAGWGDIQVHPNSPEADFCVVRGQGERDAPLLERIASSVVESVEGLSADFLEIGKESRSLNVIVPVIVTTAELVVSKFAPSDVNLRTGEIEKAQFTSVPHVRFRKSLAAASAPDEYEPESLEALSSGSERTVFVVGGSHLAEWLADFEVDARTGNTPWELARGRADAMNA
jgi:hypothetical protein